MGIAGRKKGIKIRDNARLMAKFDNRTAGAGLVEVDPVVLMVLLFLGWKESP